MINKKISKTNEKIIEGIREVAETVLITMGPQAKNVIFEDEYGTPISTNDGVTVARNIKFKNREKNIGASIVKQAVEKTNREAGDGTTTTVALLLSIIEHGLKSSGSSFEIIKGLHNCKQRIISQLQEQAKKIESKEQVEWIASLSAQDSEIGKLIADIVEDIGYDGVISVEEGKQMGLEKEIVTGMGFDEGYDSHYFVTDVARMEAIIEHPYILVTNHTISSVKDIIGIFDQIAESGRKDVVIVANEVKGDALNALVQNKMKGLLNIVTVRCPGTGDQKNKFLEDLAVVTGATFVNRDLDMDLESVSLNMLGQADRVVSKKNETMIVSGKGSKEEIARHVEKLKEMKRNEKTDNGKNMITGRIARLSGGVAVIKVGAATDIERKNRKYKIEDAIAATRSAIEEGYVPGGGVTFLRMSEDLKDGTEAEEILSKALKYPFERIVTNAGYNFDVIYNGLVVDRLFDSKNGMYVPLDGNIIDPVKVLRLALENAISAAAMVLTTGAVISNVEDKF